MELKRKWFYSIVTLAGLLRVNTVFAQGNSSTPVKTPSVPQQTPSGQAPSTTNTPPQTFTPVTGQGSTVLTTEQSNRLKLLRSQPRTGSIQLVHAAQNVSLGDRISVPIPDGTMLVLLKSGGESKTSEDFTWTGGVQGEERSSASIVAIRGEIAGSITTKKGLYRISPLGEGAYAVAKITPRSAMAEEPTSTGVPKKPQVP